MKIYTKTGDTGETSLYGGKRVGKDDARVTAYGGVDEANSSVGFLKSYVSDENIQQELAGIQSDLLTIGAYLAGSPEKLEGLEDRTKHIEQRIDAMEAVLAPLHNFILPGGSTAAAAAHMTRSTVRRAERGIVALTRVQPVDKRALEYLNRLSDYFFVLARCINKQKNISDIIWNSRREE